MWLTTHPYRGVFHDARYYLIQTLNALDSNKWAQDLYFKYGNQDSFSLFSNGYKWVVIALGSEGANLVATIVGDALWLVALGSLICAALTCRVERMAAICGVIVLASGYGHLSSLHYAEFFVTPRLFAEAATMGGLALVIQQRHVWASALFLLAFLFHPLIAIPGIGVVVIAALRRDRRAWMVLGLLLCAIAAGIGLKVEPFVRAREFYDTDWFQVIKARDELAMISIWSSEDYARIVAACTVLIAFLIVATDRERRFVVMVLVIAVGGCVASFVGADLAHNVLIMNLQLWRAMWLANVASNAVFPLLILRSRGSERIVLVVGFVFGFFPRFLFSLAFVSPFIVLLSALWFLFGKTPGERIRFFLRGITLICLSVYLVLAAYALYLQIADDFYIGEYLPSLVLTAASIFGLAWSLRQPMAKWLIPAVIFVLVTSAILVDQRTSWNRYVYGSGPDGGLQKFLADAGTIYWEGINGADLLWFKAGKPIYYSCVQGTESIFFRPLALEWFRRLSVIRLLNTEDFKTLSCGTKVDPSTAGPHSQAQIAAVCQALPDLDTLILNHPIPELAGQSWTAPTYQEIVEGARRKHVSTFYRYSCTSLR